MKNIRAVVKKTTSRPKRRPMVVLSSSVEPGWSALLPPFARACRAAPVQGLSVGRLGLGDCRLQLQMQLCHTHRQLLSRCTLRWYSVGTSSDTIAASDVQVPARLKRPVASTFGGIDIRTSRLLYSSLQFLIVFIPISPFFF